MAFKDLNQLNREKMIAKKNGAFADLHDMSIPIFCCTIVFKFDRNTTTHLKHQK